MSVGISDYVQAGADPVAFFRLATGHEPDTWQADLLRSEAQRVLLLAARQVGKSTSVGVLAVHRALYDPGSLVLMISPSQRQSGELFRQALEAYKGLGRPIAAEGENETSLRLENGSRIVSLPGSEATTRGFSSPAMVIVDEAARIDDQLWEALLPMTRGAARIILLSTPAGRRGIFYEQWASQSPDWHRIRVAATESKLWTEKELSRQRELLGDYSFKQEFGLEFIAAEGQIFMDDVIEAAFNNDLRAIDFDDPTTWSAA
jgi:terminase large subunit-like protein